MKYQTKAQRITNEIRAYLIRNDTEITPSVNLQLELLEGTLLDYFNTIDYIEKNGYIQQFNKGTSIGLSPLLKLKYDSIKQIRKLISEIMPNNADTENAEDFINSLITN
jgi:EAL domain-containing protein (putative c-di-GMP-specific phosphodiesterase class I)